MAHIIVIGAGLGGLPTAYELRHLLPHHHQITLISDTPQFTFLPSLPWVALGLTALESIQVKLLNRLEPRGIHWVQGRVEGIDPDNRQLIVNQEPLSYDYLVIATGAELDLDAVPGLGPDNGYTQSVCNPHHAQLAQQAWQQFLKQPGPLVMGAVPGASCFGPAYEFALLADHELRKRGLRDQVPITFVTPEPYAGQWRRAIALQGAWVGWAKTAFEQYFLAKMRLGAAVPWFERLALKGVGLLLVEPLATSSTDCLHGTPC
ncbi:FAD-dependent oxidoreductase [Leptothermofonsia sichuanensis E412]|uniref:NAD(P)/FAD-dependent oxidoreductase n=1 Tax=Leptothermofonsia sichuanensis TaxID=2917832 RepID=UPI001CA71CAE|nr:FAD-dependent oxidoreductase [Leptothermofonsia sichuanensis]QZZ21698.1 FAD-dependent oxidoreductase [Leptothermofonsia sichuanensis E412]